MISPTPAYRRDGAKPMGQSMRGLITHALPVGRRIPGIKNLSQAVGATPLILDGSRKYRAEAMMAWA